MENCIVKIKEDYTNRLRLLAGSTTPEAGRFHTNQLILTWNGIAFSTNGKILTIQEKLYSPWSIDARYIGIPIKKYTDIPALVKTIQFKREDIFLNDKFFYHKKADSLAQLNLPDIRKIIPKIDESTKLENPKEPIDGAFLERNNRSLSLYFAKESIPFWLAIRKTSTIILNHSLDDLTVIGMMLNIDNLHYKDHTTLSLLNSLNAQPDETNMSVTD